MIKIRRPLVTTFLLFVIVSSVYYMTSSGGNTGSLGLSSPLNLLNFNPLQQIQEDSLIERPPLAEETENKDKAPSDSISDLTHDQGEEIVKDEVSDSISNLTNDHVKNGEDEKSKKKPKKAKKVESELEDGFTETPFMPKMADETLKAQLGNAAWKLFHTILARYPDKPSKQEQATLKQYINLFAQVYPCGDCARHFRKLLNKYPPQTLSRKNAALWGCDIHNKVNTRLNKPIYDCTNILEDYDCGCGEDEKEADFTLGNKSINELNKEKETVEKETNEKESNEKESNEQVDDIDSSEKKQAPAEKGSRSRRLPHKNKKKKKVNASAKEAKEHLNNIIISEKEEEPQLGG